MIRNIEKEDKMVDIEDAEVTGLGWHPWFKVIWWCKAALMVQWPVLTVIWLAFNN
jgi:hypothetical protein